MGKCQFKFITVGEGIPLINLTNDNISIWGLVDTGAESTHIDGGFVGKNKSCFNLADVKDKINLVTFSSDKQQPLAKASFEIKKNKCTLEIECIMSDISRVSNYCRSKFGRDVGLILGSDMLDKYKAIIDYESKKITFQV